MCATGCCGFKLYLNVTTGGYLLDPEYLLKIFRAWDCPKPIMLHAEADVVGTALGVTAQTGQPTTCATCPRGRSWSRCWRPNGRVCR